MLDSNETIITYYNMKKENISTRSVYLAPECEALELRESRVLCASEFADFADPGVAGLELDFSNIENDFGVF